MSLFSDLQTYGRFAWGLRGFLSHTLTVAEAQADIRRRLAEREASFLRLMEKSVYGYTRSPYLPLLRLAQVELGDVRNLVRDQGLEAALLALRQAGVYVTFEELKGRQPIERQGQVFPVQARDFDNPYLSRAFQGETSGSTGTGSRVQHDLEHLAAHAAHYLVALQAHGAMDMPAALWRGILPDASGMNNMLRAARYRRIPEKWYSQIDPKEGSGSARYAAATYFIVLACRLLGAPLPWPQTVRLDEAIVVARWAAQALQTHGACLVATTVSRALRVCLAAQEAGLSLKGAVFMIAGEPVTPAKTNAIAATGARFFSTYGFTEISRLGMGCANPADATDVHLLADTCAIIQQPRQVPGMEITVPAFNVTSLLLTAPKVLLNAESDDFGIIERRTCGCALEALGYTHHIREIYSFRKLTGEGVTLVGSEMIHILETVLPARFGGSPLDYQLLEEEDERGLTRLSLVISPRLQIDDEAAALDLLANALRQGSVAGSVAQATWQQAGSLRVKRMEPVWTSRGKLLPLFVARRNEKYPPARESGPGPAH